MTRTEPNDTAARITGPANTLDLTILRAWLAQPIGGEDDGRALTVADDLNLIDGVSAIATNEVTGALGDVLQALRDDDEQDAWLLAEGVDQIDVRSTYDGDGGTDGVDVHVDLGNGVRLSSLHQDHKALTGGASDPVEAIVNAVKTVAARANDLVTEYHRATGATLTIDMAHVMLDAIVTHATAIDNGARPWADYHGNDTDPKLTPDGYRSLLTAAGKAVRGIVEGPR